MGKIINLTRRLVSFEKVFSIIISCFHDNHTCTFIVILFFNIICIVIHV